MPHRLAAAPPRLIPGLATAAEPTVPDLAIEAYRLPNGMKVVLHRDPSVPRVTVCLAYHVGAKDERAGRTGFAHFFEHMMFRGTKNVPNYDIPLQETGGQSNAFTTEDMTVYFETVPTAYLERALYLEAERLAFLATALDQEKFDTEREVVKNERRQSYENRPYGLAEEAILANVFPKGHPYSWSVIGSMADLDAATLRDLRRFFLEYYHPGNAALCLSGDFDPAQAKRWIAEFFGPLAPGKTPARPKADETPARPAKLVQADRVSLPRVYWAWPTVADDHADSPALDLLAHILTDGDASRLERALVREARVAKDVSADSDTKEIGGLFTIEATAAEGKTSADIDAAHIEGNRSSQGRAPDAGRAHAGPGQVREAGLQSTDFAAGPRLRPGDRLRREGRPGVLPARHRPLLHRHGRRPGAGRGEVPDAGESRARRRADEAGRVEGQGHPGRACVIGSGRGRCRRAGAHEGAGLVEDARRRGLGRLQGADDRPQGALQRRQRPGRPLADPADRHRPLARPPRHGRRPGRQGRPRRADRDPPDEGHEGQDRQRAGRGPGGPGRRLLLLGRPERYDALVQRPVAQSRTGAGAPGTDLHGPPARANGLRPRARPPARRVTPGPRPGRLARPARLPCPPLRDRPPLRPAQRRHRRLGQVDLTRRREGIPRGPIRRQPVGPDRRRRRRPRRADRHAGARRRPLEGGRGARAALRRPACEARARRHPPGRQARGRAERAPGRPTLGRPQGPEVLRGADRQSRLRRRLPQPAQPQPPARRTATPTGPARPSRTAARARSGWRTRPSTPTSRRRPSRRCSPSWTACPGPIP